MLAVLLGKAQGVDGGVIQGAGVGVIEVQPVGLVGGLLCLILFDTANGRLIYFVTLVLSFVFLIGPSFHSIMSAIVGFLQAPGVH